jgi:hypothetical protein
MPPLPPDTCSAAELARARRIARRLRAEAATMRLEARFARGRTLALRLRLEAQRERTQQVRHAWRRLVQ